MQKVIAAILVATLVAGCSGQNTALNRLQFSDATIPFPEHYQVEAARVVARDRLELASVEVSYPRETLGASAFGPKRWYTCIRGLPAPVVAPKLPNVETAIGQFLGQRPGVFDVVLFVASGDKRPTVKRGFDSQLCRDGAYGPITAEAPES